MALSSCYQCFRYAVFIFNFMLWLLGCALLAVGGWLLTEEEEAGRYVEQITSTSADHNTPFIISYSQVTDTQLATPLAYLLVVFGAVLILTAVIGCCGAVRDNTCLLITFLVLLMVVFAVLLGVGVRAYLSSQDVDVHTPRLHQLTNDTLREAVDKYYTDAQSREFMDAVQQRFECCGVDGAVNDYISRGPTDQSPCEAAFENTSCLSVYFNYVAQHFENFVKDRLLLVTRLSFVFAFSLAVGMVCVLLLCSAVRERSRSIRV